MCRHLEALFGRALEAASGVDEAQFVLLVAVLVEPEGPTVGAEVAKATEVQGHVTQALTSLRRGLAANRPTGHHDSKGACRTVGVYTHRPMQWRVAVEGCEPAEGSWSWERNIAEGQSDVSFHIPIRLRCSHTVTPEELARRDGAVTPSDASDE